LVVVAERVLHEQRRVDAGAAGAERTVDAIFDDPNFAGGQFSYWQRQQIKLLGVNLVNRMSLVPDLRSSKFQGQSNFVNPGLHLVNFGMDADITPKFRTIANLNLLWFDQTAVLEQFVFQDGIHNFIGGDLSLGRMAADTIAEEHSNFVKEKNVVLLVEGAGGSEDIPHDAMAIAVRMAVSDSKFDTDNWHQKYLKKPAGQVRRADYKIDGEGDMHRVE
jgi:hypothetical protein